MGKRKKRPTRAEKINYAKANKPDLRMVQCQSQINARNISREQINGVEHIIVSSWTLPDDIVMNDVLYPADEIEAGYSSLERTLAPIEHPTNSQGEYISAADPEAIHNFYAGAYNTNVTRENGRVHIEKQINVQEALKTDRGKRLLDRINELETSDKPRPIHTSVGLFLSIEKLDKPRTNAAGDQYSMIGREFEFDHDAILLDSIGAATPEQGVGMAINSSGQRVGVDRVFIDAAVRASRNLPLADSGITWSSSAALKRVRAQIGAEDTPNATYARYHLWFDAENAENFGAYKLPFVDIVDGRAMAIPAALRNAAARLSQTQGPSDAERTRISGIIDGYLNRLRGNQMAISYTQMVEQLEQLINGTVAAEHMEIEDVYEDRVIFETESGYYQVPYTISGETITLAGIPIRVEKMVEYQPLINKSKGDEQMKQLILNALAKAGISTDGLSDDDLLAAYNKLLANQGPEDEDEGAGDDTGDDGGGEAEPEAITKAVNKAVKPLLEKIESLSKIVNANGKKKRTDLIDIIVSSKHYIGIEKDDLDLLTTESLERMVSSCGAAHGLPLTMASEKNDAFSAPAEMPE